MAPKRFRIITACSAGGLLGVGFAHGIQLADYGPATACLASVAPPALFCFLAGLRGFDQLAKVAAYACLGWVLTYALRPQIAGVNVPPTPLYWYAACSCVSLLLAIVGSAFAPIDEHAIPPTGNISELK